ncbi:MAG: hypothetical protein RLZZ175_920 [Bacteroidota bacterium]|jgi:uncharacterized membrane protein SpoIIM required for sporulation/uncharacterized protein YsxB (DUF464 family)
MKEKDFINKSKEKWVKLEEIVFENKKNNSKNLADYFIQTTEDLAYARTFYPNRSVRLYLNNLSQNIYNKIYRNKALKFSEFITFFKFILPSTMYEYRKTLYLCITLFIVALSIGVVSSANDTDFAKEILGQQYVEMTIDNINKKDPMAVYKQGHSIVDFLRITENNIRVSLLTFVSGLLAGIGSLGIMIQNGIMVGVFQYFFYERDLLLTSFLTIWMHGAFEICSIIIAGTAGMVLGSGMLFTGTYSRFLSFRYSALASLRIITGVIPFIIVAGFIEGFLTRYTDIHPIVKAVFIFSCFAFMAFYFIIYPRMLGAKGITKKYLPQIIPYKPEATNKKFLGIRTHAELFSDTTIILSENIKKVLLISSFSGILLLIINSFIAAPEFEPYFNEENFFLKIYKLFTLDQNRTLQFLAYSFSYTCIHIGFKQFVLKSYKKFIDFGIAFIAVLVINYLIVLIGIFDNMVLGIIQVPALLIISFIFSDNEVPFSQKFSVLFKSLVNTGNQSFFKLPVIIFVIWGTMLVMSSPVMGLYLGFVYMNIEEPKPDTTAFYIIKHLPELLNYIVYSFNIVYANIYVYLVYNNMKEIISGKVLSNLILTTPVKKN